MKPKVLFLTGASPYPLTTGAKIRTYNLLKCLASQFEIDLLTITTSDDELAALETIRAQGIAVHSIQLPSLRSGFKKLRVALKAHFKHEPYLVRRYTTELYRKLMSDLLAKHEYEVVHCDSISMAGYLSVLPKERVILTQHNVEHEIWEGYAKTAHSPWSRAFFARQHQLVHKLEAGLDKLVGHIVAVSTRDKELLSESYPAERIVVVENGVDIEAYVNTIPQDQRDTIVFTGSLDYPPNLDALEFFFAEILPQMQEQVDLAEIVIAGKNPPASLVKRASQASVKLLANVPVMQEILFQARVAIVPLRIGGGSRLKILEAGAAGIPVVATTKGAEGLDLLQPDDLLVRDDPREFAEAVLRVYNDEQLHRELATRCHARVVDCYSWSKISEPLAELWRQVASGAGD